MYVYICMYIYMYVYIHVCIYTCMYVYIYIVISISVCYYLDVVFGGFCEHTLIEFLFHLLKTI